MTTPDEDARINEAVNIALLGAAASVAPTEHVAWCPAYPTLEGRGRTPSEALVALRRKILNVLIKQED